MLFLNKIFYISLFVVAWAAFLSKAAATRSHELIMLSLRLWWHW